MRNCLILFFSISLLLSCGNGENSPRINLFSIQDDVNLGSQMRDQILANSHEYKVWDRNKHPEAYSVLDSILAAIIQSNTLHNQEAFNWELYIIEDPNVQNAFALPGGFIFVYTGLVKEMKSLDELAGVIAHEIAHVDMRHSTQALTRDYGVSFLLNLIFGEDNELISRVVWSMLSLDYSRDNELEADRKAVDYLCNSNYNPQGIAEFFSRNIEDDTELDIPEFISTHPNSAHRVEQVQNILKGKDCSAGAESNISFKTIKSYFK